MLFAMGQWWLCLQQTVSIAPQQMDTIDRRQVQRKELKDSFSFVDLLLRSKIPVTLVYHHSSGATKPAY